MRIVYDEGVWVSTENVEKNTAIGLGMFSGIKEILAMAQTY